MLLPWTWALRRAVHLLGTMRTDRLMPAFLHPEFLHSGHPSSTAYRKCIQPPVQLWHHAATHSEFTVRSLAAWESSWVRAHTPL